MLTKLLYCYIIIVLVQGDLVKLIRRVDENWFEGRLGDRRGIFPVRYVEALMEPNTPCMTPMSSRTVTPMIGTTNAWAFTYFLYMLFIKI